MSKYARTRIGIEVSDADDYSRAAVHDVTVTETPDEFRLKDVIEVATAGQSYPLSHLTSATSLLIKNNDTTNFMKIAYTSVANSGVNTIKIPAGMTALIPGGDITVGSTVTLTADTAAVVVEISYMGT